MRILRNKQTGQVVQVEDNELPKYGITASQPAAPASAPVPQKENLLATLLPLLGGIAGTALGTPFGPAGMIAGGALGSGLGETGRQGMSGKPLQGGKIVGEAALGGLGGGLGVLFKGLKVGGAAAKVAGGADEAGNFLTKAGKGMRASVVNPKVAVGPTMVSGEKEILKSATRFGLKGSAKAQLGQIDEISKGLYNSLDDVVKASTNTTSGSGIKSQFMKNLTDQGFVGDSYKNFTNAFVQRIPSGKVDASFITSFKRTLGAEMSNAFKKQLSGGALTPREEVGLSLWKSLDDAIVKIEPSAKDITMQLSELHNLAPGLAKTAAERYTMWGAKIPKTGTQALRDLTGRGLEKAGGALTKAKTPLALTGGQSLPRMLLGGGGEVSQGYTPPPSTQAEGYGVPESSPLSGLTAEKVALARLILPKKEADAIEAAYTIMGGGKEKDKSEAQFARDEMGGLVTDAISQLTTSPSIKTGPIASRLEELKSIVNVGDQDTLTFNRTISALTAAIAKARAGTSFTPNEQRMLEQYAPKIGDSSQQLLTKLSTLQTIASRRGQ